MKTYRITAQFFKKEYYTKEQEPRLLNSPAEKLEAALTCGIQERQTIIGQQTFESRTKRDSENAMRAYLEKQTANTDYLLLEYGWRK